MQRRPYIALALTALGAVAWAGCAGTCPPCSESVAAGRAPPAPNKFTKIPKRQGRTFTANGTRLWYDVWGKAGAPPLVLINGGPGFDHAYMLSSDVWERLSRGRPIVVYDQRGTGRSEPFRADGSQTLDNHVADLEALRVELHADKIDIAGHSWGGYLGMAYAIAHPDRVAHLVLCSSSAPKPEDTQTMLREYFPEEMDRFEAYVAAKKQGRDGDEKVALRSLSTALFYSGEKREEFLTKNEDLHLDQAMNDALETALAGHDMWPAVRALHTPTLILNGRYDTNIAPETAYKIHKAIPGSRLYYFERSGHFPFVEEPDLFIERLEPFLDGR